MDTINLQAFIAAAESSSFSIASEQLHLTQSAISKRIALLEEELGTRLFDRISRRVQLTEAGHTLLPQAKRILQQMRDTKTQIRDLAGDVRGTLSIATSHHIGLHRLPLVLRTFALQYPNVKLDLHFLESDAAYKAITNGEYEFAIVTLQQNTDPRIDQQAVWQDPLVFTCAPDHPLATLKNVTLEQLTQYPAILPEADTSTGQMARQLFEAKQLPLQLGLATNFLETIKMLVSAGLGWSLLPATMLDNQLSVLTVTGHAAERSLGYICYHNRTLSNAAKSFLSLLPTAEHMTQ